MTRKLALLITIIIIALMVLVNSPAIGTVQGGYAYGETLIRPREFKSQVELFEYLEYDIQFPRDYVKDKSKCIQLGEAFQQRAMEMGYLVNLDTITPAEVLQWYGTDDTKYHVVCSTPIDGMLWYIEPFNNITWWAYGWIEY